MEFRFGVLLGLAALTQSAHAGSTNYIVYESQPLVAVTNGGVFASFSESDLGKRDDGSGRFVKNEHMAKLLRKLWVYSENETPSPVGASIWEDYVGCELAPVVKAEHDVSGKLLSSKPIRTRLSGVSDSEFRRSRDEGRKLLATVLRRHKVPSAQIARATGNADVTVVRMSSKSGMSLVITADDEQQGQTLAALVIAMHGQDGRYAVSREDVSVGDASDSEGYAGNWKLGAHADLNEDGAEELLLLHSGYESFSRTLLHWDGREWREIGSSGGGC